MKKTTIGIFAHRNDAEKFINHVHNELSISHENISYIYRNSEGEEKEVDTSTISTSNVSEGAGKGAKIGATVGALGGIAAVAGMIPIVGPFFAAGTLLTALGITGAIGTTAAGAITGAAVGGVVGALVNLGVGKEKAQQYEDAVTAGNILVAVSSEKELDVENMMRDCDAIQVETYKITV